MPTTPERDDTGRATAAHEWDVLAAIVAGGVLGAEARYGLAVALPHPVSAWPWATLLTNLVGCLLIGILMVAVLERSRPAPRLLRPFLGVGVLGGFTTFSTFALDALHLLQHDRIGVALGYVVASVAGGTAAVVVGMRAARAVVGDGR